MSNFGLIAVSGPGLKLDIVSIECRLYDNVKNVSGSGECEY